MVAGLEVVLADGTESAHRRTGAAGGDRPRPHPDVRRFRGDARRGHSRHAAGVARAPGRPADGVGLWQLRRRPGRLPPDPPPGGDAGRRCASTTWSSPTRTFTLDTNVLIVLDEGDVEDVSTTMQIVAVECAATPNADRLERRARRALARAPQRRAAPSPRWSRAGIVLDTDRGGRPLVGALPALRRGRRRAPPARGDDRRQRPPVPRLSRRRLSLLHLGRPPPGRGVAGRARGRRDLPPGVGRRHRGDPAASAERSATITASGSTAGATWPRPSDPGPPACCAPSRPRSIHEASSTPASSGCPRRGGRPTWP